MSSASCCIVGRRILLALVLGCSLFAARAETVALIPGADATLIETAPVSSLGGADFFNAGTTGSGNRNRALMRFDIAGQVPIGAIIENVTLTLDLVRQPTTGPESTVFGLHRMNVSWGEGIQVPEEEGSPGLGGLAATGDATWLYRFMDGEMWSAPGGTAGVDFESAFSSAALVTGVGEPVIFEASTAMVADVQHWLDHPDQNFGWMLGTESEDVRKSARSFASRENGGGGPVLSIQYTVVPEPATISLVALGGLALILRARNRSAGRSQID